VSGFIPTLPFYEVKRGLVTDRKTMNIEMRAQEISESRLNYLCQGISNSQKMFTALMAFPEILNSIPNAHGRQIQLLEDAKRKGLIYPPISAISRIDTVGGKIVDINTKPSGFGLISSAEIIWNSKGVYPEKSVPINSDFNKLLPDNFNKAVVVTESDYPFVSDQIAMAKIAEIQTQKPWRIIYCNETEPDIKADEAVFCFSWLSSPFVSLKWINFLFENQQQFLLNPLAGRWDNKALMALPFLEINLPSGDLRTQLIKNGKNFPNTYLFRQSKNELEMAVEINSKGLEFQKVNKFNAPSSGEVYLKPLLESGARGVIVKNLKDKGTSRDTILQYAERYSSFVVQEKVKPQNLGGFNLKEGLFIEYKEPFNLLTIERMGTKVETNLIHGGNSTLIPVTIPYSEN
jgi:hypothetical protein